LVRSGLVAINAPLVKRGVGWEREGEKCPEGLERGKMPHWFKGRGQGAFIGNLTT